MTCPIKISSSTDGWIEGFGTCRVNGTRRASSRSCYHRGWVTHQLLFPIKRKEAPMTKVGERRSDIRALNAMMRQHEESQLHDEGSQAKYLTLSRLKPLLLRLKRVLCLQVQSLMAKRFEPCWIQEQNTISLTRVSLSSWASRLLVVEVPSKSWPHQLSSLLAWPSRFRFILENGVKA